MENVKYIPGDLVRSNNNPKIIWKVKDVSQDKRGNVLYRLIAVEEEDAFVYLYEPQIASIPLTPAILEANGWKISQVKDNEYYQHYPFINVKVAIKDKIALFFDAKNPIKFSFNNSPIHIDIQFVHQLQHLLFGLGLDSSLRV